MPNELIDFEIDVSIFPGIEEEKHTVLIYGDRLISADDSNP